MTSVPSGSCDDGREVGVGLVVDLADQLFDQVLDGHDAQCLAVLTDDQRHLRAVRLELAQRGEHASSIGERRHLAHHGGDRFRVTADEAAESHHPDGSIEIPLLGDRGAGVAGLQHRGEGLCAGHLDVDDHDIVARHHHLVELAFGDLERAVDDLALFGWEVLVDGDHVAEFLTADLFALQRRVAAQHAHREVGRPRQHPDDGLRERRQQVERPGHDEPPLLGALHGESFRGEFAEHQREVGEDQRDDDDGRRPGSSAEEAERFLEGFGERDGSGSRRQESGECDPDLDRGEELVRLAREAGQNGAGRRLSFESLELSSRGATPARARFRQMLR